MNSNSNRAKITTRQTEYLSLQIILVCKCLDCRLKHL